MVSSLFHKPSLVTSITYILIIKIGWAVFEKIIFYDFSKLVHNFCEKNFFELILGANLSCNGNHLPSQYGSNPSGGIQTMLILIRPLQKIHGYMETSWPCDRVYDVTNKIIELNEFIINPFVLDFFSRRLPIRSVLDTENEEF